MASTSEHTNDNVNRKEGGEENETNTLPTSSNDGEQGEQKTDKIDDLNQLRKTDILSAMQSSNENNKSDQTKPESDTSTSNINEQEQQSVVTTTTTTINQEKEQSDSTPVLSSSTTGASDDSNKDDQNKKDQLAATPSSLIPSDGTDNKEDRKTDKDKAFPIEQGDEQHLTDFQRQKAKYFFNVNLDIENKEYVTWEDVEFYLLFHLTTAGKEGIDGGDLEARLSRGVRAFWEHVHDQIPLPDGKRDQLNLNQFLDTWASLIDYVVRTNQLPPVVQDLVHLGFELYSTEGTDDKPASVQVQAFDQLFQKMNLGRPFAIMAYKYLTDNGMKPLDAEKIDSIVKAVITSSDDEHESHFLLPGFFKTVTSKPSTENKEQEKTNDRTESSNPPSSHQEQPKSNENQTSTKSEQQASSSSTANEKPLSNTSQNEASQPSVATVSSNQPQQQRDAPRAIPSVAPQGLIQQEDEGIRRLLRYYRIDDGDIVEVSGGSSPRLVLVHPERPLPPYIQQNKQLLQRLQPGAGNLSSIPENGFANGHQSTSDSKPKVALEERVSRGEAQKGPTVPLRQEQKQDSSSSTSVRQVYPQLSAAQQEEQRRQAKLQATQPVKDDKQVNDDKSAANQASLPSKEISREEQEKIIASVLKKLEPIVEKRVAAELLRLQSEDTDQDEDDHMIPFPFMFGGGLPFFAAPRGAPPPTQGSPDQQTSQQQHQNTPNPRQGNGTRADFGGFPPGAELFPPQLLMAMMNDLAQGGMGGEMPPNMPRPPPGSMGVEGFMMFVDDGQFMGGAPHPGPRF